MAEKKYDISAFYEEEPEITGFISTGCTILDLAIANKLPGGIPAGRITQFYGAPSSGKTAFGAELLGSAQRLGGKAILCNIERTWSNYLAKIYGVNCEDKKIWLEARPKTIEELFDDVLPVILDFVKDSPSPSLCLVDTLSALPSLAESKSRLADSTYGTSRAKQLGAAIRVKLSKIAQVNLALVFLDQTRTNVGVVFGDKDTVSGGEAVKFYSSVRVKLSHLGTIQNKTSKDVGVTIGFKVVKNKVAAPFRKDQLNLLFDYGFDDISTSVLWLRENDEAYPDSGYIFKDLKARSLAEIVKKIEESNRELELAEEVQRVWRQVYATGVEERKPKVR